LPVQHRRKVNAGESGARPKTHAWCDGRRCVTGPDRYGTQRWPRAVAVVPEIRAPERGWQNWLWRGSGRACQRQLAHLRFRM